MELWVGMGVIANNLLVLARSRSPEVGDAHKVMRTSSRIRRRKRGQGSPKSPDGG